MPREKTWDHYLHPLKVDCEDLLGRFQQTESVRYEDFSAIWREMDFSSIFYGEPAAIDQRMFARLALATAYNYFLPPYSFQIRAGALYILYGLYLTQLTWPKEKIWMALKDWSHVQKFVQDAVRSQHVDVVYVFRRLVSEKALFYTTMPKQLVFQRRAQNHKVCEDFRDRPPRVMDLITTETLDEITNIQGHYERMKGDLSLTSSVGVFQQDLAVRLKSCALEFHQWQENHAVGKNKHSGEDDSQQSESSQRAKLLATIKSKSYGARTEAAKSRRHRQVEIDTADSGTDHTHEPSSYTKRRRPSLRARTWKNLGGQGEEELKKYWLLSAAEEDKTALKRKQQRNRFKW